MKTESRIIRRNQVIHDRISSSYDRVHGEIFNKTEQARIAGFFSYVDSQVKKSSGRVRALDFGAGTGNLTRHMTRLGWDVTAADISQKSLDINQSETGAKTLFLKSGTLERLPDDSFDVIGTYSVLHHIPDYLEAVRTLGRLCAPLGVIVIDHEQSPFYWEKKNAFDLLYKQFKRPNWQKYFSLRNYVGKIRRLFDPAFTNEGDIHVWEEDHIDWTSIDSALAALGFEKIRQDEFFLHRADYRDPPLPVPEGFNDTRCCAYKKTHRVPHESGLGRAGRRGSDGQT